MTPDPAEREQQRLRYILESVELIGECTSGGPDAFIRQRIVQDAVIRRLETLADAANLLSDILKARHPEIPWRQVCGFRNVAAHAYAGINLSRVWEIVQDYVPPLRAAVESKLRGRASG